MTGPVSPFNRVVSVHLPLDRVGQVPLGGAGDSVYSCWDRGLPIRPGRSKPVQPIAHPGVRAFQRSVPDNDDDDGGGGGGGDVNDDGGNDGNDGDDGDDDADVDVNNVNGAGGGVYLQAREGTVVECRCLLFSGGGGGQPIRVISVDSPTGRGQWRAACVRTR